ncbi:ATP-binding protein [Sinorhizobium meliloti]|uniref:ATP-binding protein n=1 Tax=Rhizobium meliloti TaxID=382 RepID=UPI0013E286B5|nr:ATP-binding protein [Sinorhizobium meliloti]MCK3784449.1 response regulator [Sinorhizobium meliloti]MCK3790302.1 response regulator [Sinorhizobium meliloti]MCK3795802.1 response regulator [Sinorhizobium meliloti]MCO5961183.1 ATP-binding protein [Sinorhizobium meliloti]MDE3759384.1 response regulator [Sinorhizobium meliloti]
MSERMFRERMRAGAGTGSGAGRTASAAPAVNLGAAVIRQRRPLGDPSAGGARVAYALAGIVAAMLLLAVGAGAGLHLLPAIIAAGGLVGAFLLLSGRDEASGKRVAGAGETAQDPARHGIETAALLATIHDAMGDLAIVRDLDGKIMQANGAFHELCGCADARGLTCAELGLRFEPKTGPDRYFVHIYTPSGTRLYDWHDVLVRDPARGRPMRHSIARDVTEEMLAASQREEARRRAEEASRAKSRLLATVSHEIRTPLSGILGMSRLLAETRLSEEQKNYLAGMQQSGHTLVQLVEDLIDFSSLAVGRFQLRPSQEDLRQTVENVVEMLSPRAHEKNIEIGATVAIEVPERMLFDAARLRQVLFNVVGNAVKFTEKGGVFVSVDIENGSVRIRIDDSGPGMSADELARVFEEFEQAGDDAQRAKGTGLGLAISRRIMEAFGGSLTATSMSGKGSRFEIRFPMAGAGLSGVPVRRGILAGAQVLVMAPEGPSSAALAATIETLGGTCHRASTLAVAGRVVAGVLGNRLPLTDVIVDHRHAAQFRELLALEPAIAGLRLRRTYLISPEERTSHPVSRLGGYEAWLIRPLRERSLVEVLLGRLRGMEKRDAINDNRPVLREEPTATVMTSDVRGILLAEDDPVNALVLRSLLSRAGRAVDHVGDFKALEAALRSAGSAPPPLIVTDLNMPGGDGLDVLRRLREAEAAGGRRRVPVLVLTADARGDLDERLRAAGADAVLAKPADPQRLLAEVTRLMDPVAK